MTVEERKAVAKTLVEEAYGKVPLIIAAQHTDPRRVIELCRYAEDLGIDAVQMAPTYYEHGQTDDDVLRFYKLVAKSTDIGFMIYNTYWHGYNLRIHMMPKLMKIKNVVGMKWCAPTEWQYREVLRFYGDKLAIMDNQNLHVWGYIHGAVGFLSHVGTFWPEHELLIWKLLQEKKYKEANSELLKLNYPFYDLIYEVAKSTGIVDTNLTKAAVEMVGLPAGPVRPPARNITESEKKTLRALFKKAEVPLNRTI
jgi:4-hydroxy-tetrahydrodipicolinate synthase